MNVPWMLEEGAELLRIILTHKLFTDNYRDGLHLKPLYDRVINVAAFAILGAVGKVANSKRKGRVSKKKWGEHAMSEAGACVATARTRVSSWKKCAVEGIAGIQFYSRDGGSQWPRFCAGCAYKTFVYVITQQIWSVARTQKFSIIVLVFFPV